MLRIFLLLCLLLIGLVIFRAIIRSKWYTRLCDSIFGPDKPDDVLTSLDELEKLAERRATESELFAQNRLLEAAKLRERIK